MNRPTLMHEEPVFVEGNTLKLNVVSIGTMVYMR